MRCRNKEKALEKYYQDVNMSVDSENEKILQEFMDVLDNEEEEDNAALRAPHKSKTQNFSTIHSTINNTSKIHNASSNELYSHHDLTNGNTNANQSYSSKQIPVKNHVDRNKEQVEKNKEQYERAKP